MTGTLSDELFESAAGMAAATNYADWTYSLFAPYVGGAVLEVGCGVGTFTRRLAADPRLTRLLSIDISEAATARCRTAVTGSRVDVRTADVRDVDGAFDLVVCMNVLEHIEDDRGALQHMLGLLRDGGTLFLLVPSHQWLYSSFDRESGHWRRYTKPLMRRLLAQTTATVTAQHFYFNTIGALGYGFVYKILRKPPRADAGAAIGWFDRLVVPIQRRLEGRLMPFGISLVSIVTKGPRR
jgi:2-polyprenyl-3-methyl-5-hydroxy-6-metoxy-1,4-benzoquinol methylase